MKLSKNTAINFFSVFVLITIMLSAAGCRRQNFTQKSGFWKSNDENIIIDFSSYLTKIVSGGEEYYFDLAVAADYEKVYIFNDYDNYKSLQMVDTEPAGLVISGRVCSYDEAVGMLEIEVDEDYYFDFKGKTVNFSLIGYENATENVLAGDCSWKNTETNEIYNFGEGTWTGNIDGIEYNGNISVFPTGEVIALTVVTGKNADVIYNSYIAEVIEKDDNGITFKIVAANGVFENQKDEIFTLTEVLDAKY